MEEEKYGFSKKNDANENAIIRKKICQCTKQSQIIGERGGLERTTVAVGKKDEKK